MNKKFIIYSDIDETINNLIRYTLPLYNKKYCDNITFDMITEYDIGKFIKISSKQYFDEFSTEEILFQLTLEEGCKDVLDWINSQSWIDFRFVTHAYIPGLESRDKWITNLFNWYDGHNQLWRVAIKQRLYGDLMFEDCYDNLLNASYNGVLFDKPYNKNIKINEPSRIYRCDKWDDDIIELIKYLAKRKGIVIS